MTSPPPPRAAGPRRCTTPSASIPTAVSRATTLPERAGEHRVVRQREAVGRVGLDGRPAARRAPARRAAPPVAPGILAEPSVTVRRDRMHARRAGGGGGRARRRRGQGRGRPAGAVPRVVAGRGAVGDRRRRRLARRRPVRQRAVHVPAHPRRQRLGGYNVVRHGGVQLALEQAPPPASPGPRRPPSAGASGRSTASSPPAAGWRCRSSTGEARTGGERPVRPVAADAAGGDGLDRVRRRASSSSGGSSPARSTTTAAVSSRWDPATDAAVPGTHDRFFTGQVLWALDGIGRPASPTPTWTRPSSGSASTCPGATSSRAASRRCRTTGGPTPTTASASTA